MISQWIGTKLLSFRLHPKKMFTSPSSVNYGFNALGRNLATSKTASWQNLIKNGLKSLYLAKISALRALGLYFHISTILYMKVYLVSAQIYRDWS